MKTAAPSLTEEEFDRLSALLGQAGPGAMNIEMLDGFFAALICGPDLVPPSEYLPEVWGEDFVFESDEQVNELLGLLMKHWNAVADGLQRSLGGEEVYMPVLLEDETGIARGNDWAAGFIRGVSMRIDDWQVLFNDEEHGGPLVVIMMLLYENSPDPELRPPPIPDDKRADIHVQLTAGLIATSSRIDGGWRASCSRSSSGAWGRRSAVTTLARVGVGRSTSSVVGVRRRCIDV